MIMSNKPKGKTGSRKKTQARTSTGAYTTKLTRKQKAFADELLNNPKISNTEAAARTYNITDRATAGVMAAENLKKPSVLMYLEAHKDKAQEKIVELIDSKNESIALKASESTLDRTVGKPTQRTEVTQQTLRVTIDLTGEE